MCSGGVLQFSWKVDSVSGIIGLDISEKSSSQSPVEIGRKNHTRYI